MNANALIRPYKDRKHELSGYKVEVAVWVVKIMGVMAITSEEDYISKMIEI